MLKAFFSVLFAATAASGYSLPKYMMAGAFNRKEYEQDREAFVISSVHNFFFDGVDFVH